jgi:ribonuclease Z
MRPLLHPHLVNGRYGDPAVYVESLFERRGLLFDLGEIAALAPRKIQAVEQVFVSHAHIDHFIGFDHLLRLMVGREKTIEFFGPAGFAERVHHKLQAYRWNLVEGYACDLVLVVTEILAGHSLATTRFRLKTAFAPESLGATHASDGVVYRGPSWQVSAAILDHRTPCLGFALQERAHVNVWKNRLAERGLPVGPWLKPLKQAVLEGRPDDHPILVDGAAGADARKMPFGELRDVVTVTVGQKIAYVTDVADSPANRAAIEALAKDADILFIEAAFAAADVAFARERAHLTTTAAGEIAWAAKVRRIEPFHFSPRYPDEEARMLGEVMASFRAQAAAPE